MHDSASHIEQYGFSFWLVIAFCAMLTGCETKASTSAPISNGGIVLAERNLVDTMIVVSRSISKSITCTGKIRCADQQQISSLVGGRILGLNLVPGAYFEAGRLVVSLDSRLTEIELEEAKLNLRIAQEKYEELIAARPDGDSLSPKVLSRWELTAGIPSARLQLRKANLNFEASSIHLSEPGWVGEVKVKPGQEIFPGTHIADFFPDRRLEAELYLLDLPSTLLPGATVLVNVPGQEQEVSGRIRSFLPEVNKEGFVVAYLSLPAQKNRLLPGQQITARIENLTDQLYPMIPAEAVLRRGGRDVAFLYHNGLAEWTYVETGSRHGEQVQIREGISVGDTILTAGHQQLGHGAVVKIASRNSNQP